MANRMGDGNGGFVPVACQRLHEASVKIMDRNSMGTPVHNFVNQSTILQGIA